MRKIIYSSLGSTRC